MERNVQQRKQRSKDTAMNGTRNSPIVSVGKTSPRESQYRPRVLVVDDESVIADTIAKILFISGYETTAAYDGDGALQIALLKPPELLITDVVLPGMNGVELAITIKRIYPDCKILLFSGQASTADLLEAAGLNGHHFTLLNKPVPPQDLITLVAAYLNTASSERTTSAA